MKIAAELIYTGTGKLYQNHLIILDSKNKIVAIDDRKLHDPGSYQMHHGAIIPAFINAHCHLELSHLLNSIPQKTGLLEFLLRVVQHRGQTTEKILQAIQDQDEIMWQNGIQAVGDICNTTHTAQTKLSSPIRYYNFVEMFDLLQDEQAQYHFDSYLKVYHDLPLKQGDKKSIVPHAPYTVSNQLFKKIKTFNQKFKQQSISIHNQETKAEDQLFIHGRGGFFPFYKNFDIDLTGHWTPSGKSSIHHSLQYFNHSERVILVHNTLTTKDDITYATSKHPNIFWTTCPNANLYIENQLPKYHNFIESNAKLCIGTDSLSSNHQLSILEEIKTIKKYQPDIDDQTLLQWATINGAQALGFDDTLGTIEIGKQPGLLLIKTHNNKISFEHCKYVKRLI